MDHRSTFSPASPVHLTRRPGRHRHRLAAASIAAFALVASASACSTSGSGSGSAAGSSSSTYTVWDPYPQFDASSAWVALLNKCGSSAGVTLKRTAYDTTALTSKELLAA